MDVLTIVATSAITTLVGAVVGAAVTNFIKLTNDKRNNDSTQNKAMHEGMKQLLIYMAKGITEKAVEAGEVTIEDRSIVHGFCATARDLGANGESHELDRAIDGLPIKHK